MTRVQQTIGTVQWLAAAMALTLAHAAFAQWSQTSGPPGGELDQAVGDGSASFFAAIDGVLLRTDDAGDSFVLPTGAGLPDGAARPVLLTNGLVFAVVSTSVDAADLYVSSDGGESWTPTGLASIVEDLADATLIRWQDVLLAYVKTSTTDKLLTSDDFGQTWTLLHEDMGTGFGIQFVALSDAIVSSQGGASRSDDGGETWDYIADNIPVFNVWSLVSVSEQAIIVRGGFGSALYRTFNDGQTWSSMIASGTGNAFNPTATLPDQSLLMPHESGLFHSTNNGSNWTLLNPPGLPNGPVIDIVSLGASVLMINNSTGAFISTDAAESWSFIGDAFTSSSVARLRSANGILFATTSGTPHTFRSHDDGETWLEVTLLLSTFPIEVIDVIAVDAQTLLATSATRGTFLSDDGGQFWTQSTSGLPVLYFEDGDTPIYEPMNAVAQLGDAIFVGTGGATIHVHDGSHCSCTSTTSGQGVFRSLNNGQTWQSASNGLPINTFDTGGPLLHPINLIRVIDDSILAGTPHNGIYRSTNLGANWSPTGGLPTGIENELVDLDVVGETAFALTAGGLYQSINEGLTWSLVNDEITFGDMTAINGELFAGGSSNWFKFPGVFRSADGGASWTPTGQPVDDLIVHAVHADGDTLFAGTHGQGVWALDPDLAQLGDLNNDGQLNADDHTIFCSTIGSSAGDGAYIDAADFNNDSVIDHLDLATLNQLIPACTGDVVSSATFQPPADGVTDAADLAYLLGAWANQPSCADFVSSKTFQPPPDGVVDGADLAFLLGAWGICD
jgi:photosystem II stability/assembly factor-like uncharacterized protein